MRAETPRLLVRPFTEDDAEALFAILSDPEVMRCIEPPFTLAQTRAFLRDAGLCHPPKVCAVIRKADGALIGQLIWHPFDENTDELGWILRRDFWGQGYARELTEAMLARAERGVVIEGSPEQASTRRIAEKYGFRPAWQRDGLDVYKYEKTAR